MFFPSRHSLSGFLFLALAIVQPADPRSVPQPPPKSALARRGLHHVDITGRFLSPQGNPVPRVHVRLTSGRPHSLPVRQVDSADDGRFAFRDVNCQFTPILRWQPPQQWSPGGSTVAAESFERLDLGEIWLASDTTVRLAVQLVGGQGSEKDALENLSIALEDASSDRVAVAVRRDDFWVMPHIPFQRGEWRVSYYGDRTERFDGEFQVETGRRDQFLLLRLRRDLLKPDDDGGLTGPVEVAEMISPGRRLDHEFRASGRILGPNGSAISGAVVGVGEAFGDALPASTVTDASGWFELAYRADKCRNLEVAFLGPADVSAKDDKRTCEEKWLSGSTHSLQSTAPLAIRINGAEPNQVQGFWWHSVLGWVPVSAPKTWLSLSAFTGRVLLKMEAPGRLPLLRELTPQELRDLKGKAPEPIETTFSFDEEESRELLVVGSGKPIGGAIVDIEAILDLSRDRRAQLGAYHTDSEGRLLLSGGGAEVVEVFVWAPGFEPRRAIWEPGRPLKVDLVPRTSLLVFPALRPGCVARVYPIGRPQAARTVRADYKSPRSVRVTAGDYDAVVLDPAGSVTGYQRVSVEAGETRQLDVAVDQRPRLIVAYPEDGWTSSVSDSTPSGTPIGWAAYSFVGQPAFVNEAAAQLESESPREASFRLSKAGRFHVEAKRRDQQHSLWREIDVARGETLRMDVPKAEAVLRGSIRTYDGGIGFSQHGWAGPRLLLISDDPSGWSATAYLPHRDEDMTFTLQALPSGDYHLYQHLIGTPKTSHLSKGDYHYTAPIDAWGGIPVTLQADRPTMLRDFIDYPFHDLSVTVLDPGGKPLNGATLRVRDRMSEAWRQVAEGPTTLAYAAHPIPYPPAVRLADGRATLPSIRAGRLELFVERDDGRVQAIVTDVDPDQPLTIQMPRGNGH